MSHIEKYAPLQKVHASYKINLYDKVYKEQTLEEVIAAKVINKGVLHPGTNPPRITTNITTSGTATYELRERCNDPSTLWKGNHGPRTFGTTLKEKVAGEPNCTSLQGEGKDDDGAEFELELCIFNFESTYKWIGQTTVQEHVKELEFDEFGVEEKDGRVAIEGKGEDIYG